MGDSYLYADVFTWIINKRSKLFKCDLCNLDFIFQKDMLDHFGNDHKPNICYACSFCSKEFKASDPLVTHMKTQHVNNSYLCSKCDFHCKSEENVVQHASIHVDKNSGLRSKDKNVIQFRSLACGDCSRIFTQPSLLRRHTELHSNTEGSGDNCQEKPQGGESAEGMAFICGECKKKFSSLEVLKGHMRTAHKIEVQDKIEPLLTKKSRTSHVASPSSPYLLCIFCLKRFSNRCLLESHERIHSRDIDPEGRLISICDLTSFGEIDVMDATESLHRKSCNEPKKERRSCSPGASVEKECLPLDENDDKEKNFLEYVQSQIKSSSECSEAQEMNGLASVVLGPKGILPECRSKRLEEGLLLPERRGTSTRRTSSYVCHQCRKGFRSKVKFLDHYFEHDKTIRSFTCRTCDARFGYSSSMPKHVLMHRRDLGLLGPRQPPNLCPRCGKYYRDLASLKRHEAMVHLKVGHLCQACDRKFSSSQALKQHARQHAGDFVYRCDLCPKRYANPSSLHNHKRTHSESKFSCSVCTRSFSLKHHLTRHLARHAGPVPREKS